MTGPAALPGGAMAALQAKLTEKIRADIGELLPEELVREMVATEARAFFFEPTVTRTVDRFGTETKEITLSPFQTVVREMLAPVIDKVVRAEVSARAAMIDAVVRDAVAGDQAQVIAAATVATVVRQSLAGLAGEIVQDLRNSGVFRAY